MGRQERHLTNDQRMLVRAAIAMAKVERAWTLGKKAGRISFGRNSISRMELRQSWSRWSEAPNNEQNRRLGSHGPRSRRVYATALQVAWRTVLSLRRGCRLEQFGRLAQVTANRDRDRPPSSRRPVPQCQ